MDDTVAEAPGIGFAEEKRIQRWSMATNIQYVMGREELLDRVKNLWQELNTVHLEKSPHFRDFYANTTFEERKNSLSGTAQNGRLCIVLAYAAEMIVGYCIASVVDDTGEIDSIYVVKDHRKMGIAGHLLDMALGWLEQGHAKNIRIKVSVGNEEVFGFYARYGFYPRLTELQRLPE